MSLGTAQLSASLQALIDARLDTIDRMLLGRVPRQDRLSIVREVESQLFELLHERDQDELTREDVLAVLGRLDPPEAYLPDAEEETGAVGPAARPISGLPTRSAKSKTKAAKASGILGLSALAIVLLSPLIYLIGVSLNSEVFAIIFFCGSDMATFAASLLAIILGALGRRGGAWAIVGMITGGLSLLFAIGAGILLLIELLGSVG